MNLQDYYEESYRNERGRSTRDMLHELTTYSQGLYQFVTESKDRFLPNLDWNSIKILETGAGRGGVGLLLAKLGARITLIDFSPTALEQAQSIYAEAGFQVDIIEGDVTHPDIDVKGKFHIIVDSHLLHCLTEDPDRASYYRFISDNLFPEGIFVAETMVYKKNLMIPDGFMFDERNVLWQMLGKWTPVRRILDSLDLEAEIKNAQLSIVFFYYYGQFGFVPHRSFMDIPTEILPAAVRMVLKN